MLGQRPFLLKLGGAVSTFKTMWEFGCGTMDGRVVPSISFHI